MKKKFIYCSLLAVILLSISAVAKNESAFEKAYTRYRFVVDAPKSDGASMQLSEVELFDEAGKKVPSSAFTLGYDASGYGRERPWPEDEGPINAIDGDLDTKWLDWRAGLHSSAQRRAAVYLDFKFPAPKKISGYAWYTANDYPGRNPAAWRVLASNDGASWTELDKVTHFTCNGFRTQAFNRSFARLGNWRFKIDASRATGKIDWLEATLEAMAPKAVELLYGLRDGSRVSDCGGEVDVSFYPSKIESSSRLSSEVCTTLVNYGSKTLEVSRKPEIHVEIDSSDRDSVVRACLREFVRSFQIYRNMTSHWLESGIAEWVILFNFSGEDGADYAKKAALAALRCDANGATTASFLDFLVRTRDADIVSKLHAACCNGVYRTDIWKTFTGSTLKELEGEWIDHLNGRKHRTPIVVSSADAKDILDLVDPFIGSAGTGHTTPAAAYPFGMVQPGPDTGLGGWEHCSSYQYGDSSIMRFSQTHLSGTGCSDFSDVAFMPFVGDIGDAISRKFKDGIVKAKEKASPGYYSVELKSGVKVEITCTEHVAIYRIKFGKRPARLLYDPTWGHGRVEAADIKPMKNRRVSGHVGDRRGWPDRDYYFSWEVSVEPTAECVIDRVGNDSIPVTVYSFDNLKEGEELFLKVSLSQSSEKGARGNIDAEVPAWDFDGVLAATRAKWRTLLSRVSAKGVPENLKILYTSVYHLCFQPNRLSDAGEAPLYSTFSCWDIYRAAGPLYTILTPEYVPLFVNSMIWHFDRNGFLPVWTLWGRDNQCMIGAHSVPMVIDAYLKGFGGVDWEAAFDCVKTTLTKNRKRHKARYDLINKYGYYPCDIVKDESVSRLLEDCYDQSCAARFAKVLGKEDDAAFFYNRSLNWTNVFDSATGFMRGKDSRGNWRKNFDPYKVSHIGNCEYTEGNAFHWNWHVMQEPELLVNMLGGKEKAVERLVNLFNEDSTKGVGAIPDVSGLIGQYCHGNEPSHHNIYFFTLLGRRDLTAKYIREVFDTQYDIMPDGICGNEDCGQMSAWYIFSAMGFYPFDPCGGKYVLGEPQFNEITVQTGNGKVFRVVSDSAGNPTKAVIFNNKKIDSGIIDHKDVINGGTLHFVAP